MALNFVSDSEGRLWQPKSPAANLDYTLDWTQWLEGDTIATAAAVADTLSGIVIGTIVNTTTMVSMMVSGGTLGAIGSVTVTITTAGGRTETQTFYLYIVTT